VKFLIDAQLPPALAGWLREAGHEASHVEDAGLRDAEDGATWAHASKTGAIIVTKDEDFAARSIQTESAPMIVGLRVGHTTNRVLRLWFEARLVGVVQLAGQQHRLIEVI
jgi:predicted nuclease of predicted toxin-antitoxin system